MVRSVAQATRLEPWPRTLLLVRRSNRAPTLESDALTLEGQSDGCGRTGRRLWPMLRDGPSGLLSTRGCDLRAHEKKPPTPQFHPQRVGPAGGQLTMRACICWIPYQPFVMPGTGTRTA